MDKCFITNITKARNIRVIKPYENTVKINKENNEVFSKFYNHLLTAFHWPFLQWIIDNQERLYNQYLEETSKGTHKKEYHKSKWSFSLEEYVRKKFKNTQ